MAVHRLSSKWIALFTSIMVIFASIPCWGWGRQGHQIIAAVAEDHLDQTTKVMIQSLIGNNHLYSVSTWADDIRKVRHNTAPWHYVNIPLGNSYNPNRDCAPPNSCVVVKIAEFLKVLTDKRVSRDDRAEALKFIVHFVGDIHQPMHAVGEARGGNEVHLSFLESTSCGRYDCNFHGVWDSDLIGHRGFSREEYVRHEEELIRTDKLEALNYGAPDQWADESLKVAQSAWVRDGADLDGRYYEKQIKVADRQLALAGLRLAKLLNESIGKMTPKDFPVSVTQSMAQASSERTRDDIGSAVKVWVNTKSHVYHCPDTRWYGNTKQGAYMSESNAVKNGYRPAGGKSCSSF